MAATSPARGVAPVLRPPPVPSPLPQRVRSLIETGAALQDVSLRGIVREHRGTWLETGGGS